MFSNIYYLWLSNNPNYAVVLLIIFISIIIGMVFQLIGLVIAPSTISLDKQSAYECGFDPFGDARSVFEISFYKTSILFLLFDLELVFVTPFATVLFGWEQIYIFYFFLILLIVGFIYEWSVSALEWN